MGILHVEHLDSHGRVYACKSCLASNDGYSGAHLGRVIHLASASELLSKVSPSGALEFACLALESDNYPFRAVS